ncbi:MAG: SpoIID/LytB domain-containing protein, partial [Clostridiales bacterium]
GAVISIINPAGQLEQVYLEDFVVQAVAAEMPISFGKTALKAQAVAARTYIAAHVEPYGQGRHEGAAVCCDSHHCQAYATIVQLKKNWRENFSANWALVRQAVADTAGEVLFYQQKIAETPYYSCCGGSTEAAADCWGGDRPYLQAKFCNYCAASPKLVGVTRLTVAEAAQKLAVSSADIYDMYIVAYTDGGRVGQMMIGGKLYGGAVLRSALALPSAAFSWLIVGRIFFSPAWVLVMGWAYVNTERRVWRRWARIIGKFWRIIIPVVKWKRFKPHISLAVC